MDASPEAQLEAAAVLADPVRRALYLHVARQPAEVGRDAAARTLRIDRSLAAFHLDKLVEAGLLEATYRRLSGRTGPGAGRPSKLYRRSARAIELSVPPRRFDLLARLLVGALSGSKSASAVRALSSAARALGKRLGSEVRSRLPTRARSTGERVIAQAEQVMEEAGFEPYRDGRGDVRLRNCPFHELARDHREIVCAMNVELAGGVLEGLGARGVTAAFEPREGECCVVLRRRATKR